jgi:hypothetical protein
MNEVVKIKDMHCKSVGRRSNRSTTVSLARDMYTPSRSVGRRSKNSTTSSTRLMRRGAPHQAIISIGWGAFTCDKAIIENTFPIAWICVYFTSCANCAVTSRFVIIGHAQVCWYMWTVKHRPAMARLRPRRESYSGQCCYRGLGPTRLWTLLRWAAAICFSLTGAPVAIQGWGQWWFEFR